MKIHSLKLIMFVLVGVLFLGISCNYAEGTKDRIESICNKYCSGIVKINYKNTDYSSELTKRLAKLKIDELINNLNNNLYPNNQIPEALQYLALKLMQGKNIDDSIRIYKCAAEKYYNMIAMYRMARVYKNGTDNIKKQFPDAIIINEIKPDLKKAYFWIASLMLVEMAEKTGKITNYSQFSWNSKAIFDELQNSGKLSNRERAGIENNVHEFIGKRYPWL